MIEGCLFLCWNKLGKLHPEFETPLGETIRVLEKSLHDILLLLKYRPY